MKAKKSIIIIIITLTAALLTACGAPDAPAPEPNPTPPPAVTAPPDPADAEAMRQTFEIILDIIYYEHVLPDRQPLDWDETAADAENLYAVYDVDGDGQDELIIEYNSTYDAGRFEVIYAHDPETGWVFEQLWQYPGLTYYDNGVIKAPYARNEGLAGRFWPFRLFKHDPANDVYECVAMAEAWDSSLHGDDYVPFPTEIDKSGEGIVYYLLGPDDKSLGQPVDRSEYDAWLSGYIGGAQELTLPKIPLEPSTFAEGVSGTLDLWRELHSERGHYSPITNYSKSEVERFALEVRRAILERDWDALAARAAFPLLVNGESCPDAETLLAMAPELLTGEGFVAALVSETCEDMFFNFEGIMLADGRVRFSEIASPDLAGELRVTSINTPDT